MLQIGNISEFDDSKEDFTLYVERMEEFFQANNIKKERKVPVFLSIIGPEAYKLLRNLIQPKLPKNESYDEIINALTLHYKPVPIIISERYKFHQRNQNPQESIAAYIVELKRLASTCAFSTFLKEAIRDRFVCGIQCENTKKRLLSRRTLTMEEAFEIATAMELAEHDAKDIKNEQSINVISKSQTSKVKNKQENFKTKNIKNMKNTVCYRCEKNHLANECKYKNVTCYKCRKIGHISTACKSKIYNKKQYKANCIYDNNIEVDKENDDETLAKIYSIHGDSTNQNYIIPVKISSVNTKMILDTAADLSTVSESWIKNNLHDTILQSVNCNLRDYNNHNVEVLGRFYTDIQYGSESVKEYLYVVKGSKSSLFGKNLITAFNIDIMKTLTTNKISEVKCQNFDLKKERHLNQNCTSLEKLIIQYGNIFMPSLEPIKMFKAKIVLDKAAKPVYCKARNVPYALKAEVEKQIEENINKNVWQRVQHSEWATPLVLVPKSNSKLRICGDFKVTVNKCLKVNQYPLPNQKDLFAMLNGGNHFTKLDLSNAYQQIQLDDESQEILTLNTHMGLMKPTRMLYGIASAAAVFQSVMDRMLQGLKNVLCYQDDILIIGSDLQDHNECLKQTLSRLDKYGVKLNREKCHFNKSKIEYLGYVIDSKGIHPTEAKTKAIQNIKSPKDVSQLRTFLGTLNYYIKFIKNAATVLHPLYNLLKKDVPWKWNAECEDAFNRSKEMLTSRAVLTHYDPNKPIKVECDASPYGLGAILSHIMPNGDEKPVIYASRTLTRAERNYPQIEREALAIIFAIKKFEQYLFGKKFTIVTDHKPLTTLFSPTKATPVLAAARIQRWSILLGTYQYDIQYREGKKHTNVDMLSRLPLDEEEIIEGNMFKLSHLEEMPITAKEIAEATKKDPVLIKICNYVKWGWNKVVEENLQPFFIRREQLSFDKDCLLWGMRIIIPTEFRPRLLNLLHDTHPGIVHMKNIARSHIWWPGIDHDIEKLSKACNSCLQMGHMPGASALQPWIWPNKPWHRIHIDFAQKGKHYFLIVVDAFSKWTEIINMKTITSIKTIEKLRELIARYGMPVEIVSDNGTQFTSLEFQTFAKQNGINHILIPPYHAQSNGQAERYVQYFKESLQKMSEDERDDTSLNHKIARFLLTQHSTPNSTTGVSPAELFLGRVIRTKISLIHSDIREHVVKQQTNQKKYFDKKHSKIKHFIEGQKVVYRDYTNKNIKWRKGKIIAQMGTNTFKVFGDDMKTRLIHADQMKTTVQGVNMDKANDPETEQISHENRYENTSDMTKMSQDLINDGDTNKEVVDIDKDIKSRNYETHGLDTNGNEQSISTTKTSIRKKKTPVRLDL